MSSPAFCILANCYICTLPYDGMMCYTNDSKTIGGAFVKKLLLLLMVFVLVMPAAYAEGENTILRYAVELGRKLDALAEDEEHVAQYTNNVEILSIIRAYGAGDHDAPMQVQAIELDALLPLVLAEVEGMPEAAVRQIQNMLPNILKQSLISSCGVNTIVASNIVWAETTFAVQDASGSELWIMTYEDASPIGIAWYAENGAVHMEAAFLPKDAQLSTELDIQMRVVAAARPVVDEYARSLANELRTLSQNTAYLQILGLPPEVLGTARSYASKENQPRMTLCALTDDYNETNAQLFQQIGYLSDISLAAVGAVQANVIFADPEASGTGLYLFLYEEGVPIIVQWRGENGAYHLNAAFQPGEMPFGCRSAEDASAWAESIGLTLNFQPLGTMLLP